MKAQTIFLIIVILFVSSFQNKSSLQQNYVKGTVKFFNESKGFGMITPDDQSKDVFVHFSGIISNGFKTLSEGQRVQFRVQQSQKGPMAVNVSTI
jgi:CspA family cold shock protein